MSLAVVPGDVAHVLIWGTPGGSIGATSATGGEAPYTWRWTWGSGATPIPNATDPSAKFGLYAASYLLTATDAAGAAASHRFVVTQPPPVVVQLESLRPCSRHDGADGTAALSVSGGVPPYLLSWSSDVTGAVLRAAAGSYVGSALDSVGGSAAITVLITQPTAFDCDVFPPDTALLADGGARDRYCRDLHANSGLLVDTLGAKLEMMMRGDRGVYVPLCAWTGVEAPDESTFGRVSAWCSNDAGEQVEALRVAYDGVTFFGGLTCSGGVTRFDVDEVRVEAPQVVLSADAGSLQDCDGGGITCGGGADALAFVYSAAEGSWCALGNLHMLDGSFRASGGRPGDEGSIGVRSFAALNSLSGCGIVLDDSGLTVTAAALQDRVPVGNYAVTDDGLLHVPDGDLFQAANGEWRASQNVAGDFLRTEGARIGASGVAAGDASISSTGFKAGNVEVGEGGIDLGEGGVMTLDSGAWRIRHDPEDDSLMFESRDGGDGGGGDTYTAQLTLD
ncbi:hypothetical protein JKP88DRAFT_272817 [Tribonema minus]|uniref:PKD domain-containing protein n=1 Tax=Tribonema minus TaxID=303371 RepID=A0A835YY33_9STRA|nr:hypothetical protein JKP88DRAFT_272817 [Tribonema minus]